MRKLWLILLLVAGAARAEAPSAADLAVVGQEAFKAGTWGESFVVQGSTEGCFDDEGFWACSVLVDGLHYMILDGSVTLPAFLTVLAGLPVGTRVEVAGDVSRKYDDRVEAQFSRLVVVK